MFQYICHISLLLHYDAYWMIHQHTDNLQLFANWRRWRKLWLLNKLQLERGIEGNDHTLGRERLLNKYSCWYWSTLLGNCKLRAVHMDTAMRIECASNPVSAFTWHWIGIRCALRSIHLGRWFGSGLKPDYIIIHDLREVTPTMRSLACSLAWLFVACGACSFASFCSAPAVTLGKKEACFLKAEKSGAVW